MDHKLSGPWTKLQFNPFYRCCGHKDCTVYFCPGKESQIIFVKKKKKASKKKKVAWKKVILCLEKQAKRQCTTPFLSILTSPHSHEKIPVHLETQCGYQRRRLFLQFSNKHPGWGTRRPFLLACNSPPSKRTRSWYKLKQWKAQDCMTQVWVWLPVIFYVTLAFHLTSQVSHLASKPLRI